MNMKEPRPKLESYPAKENYTIDDGFVQKIDALRQRVKKPEGPLYGELFKKDIKELEKLEALFPVECAYLDDVAYFNGLPPAEKKEILEKHGGKKFQEFMKRVFNKEVPLPNYLKQESQ